MTESLTLARVLEQHAYVWDRCEPGDWRGDHDTTWPRRDDSPQGRGPAYGCSNDEISYWG
ncbi:protein of unknown function [Streptomyces sp. KY75]|nr:protein of unknown function [Streptomyces sp. KY75]